MHDLLDRLGAALMLGLPALETVIVKIPESPQARIFTIRFGLELDGGPRR